MKPSDLIRDHGTGKTSHTKVWANVAYFTATMAFAWYAYKGWATGEIWLTYLGVVGGGATVSKLVSLKYGVPESTVRKGGSAGAGGAEP